MRLLTARSPVRVWSGALFLFKMKQRIFTQLDCLGATTMDEILYFINCMNLDQEKQQSYFRNGALENFKTNYQTSKLIQYYRMQNK